MRAVAPMKEEAESLGGETELLRVRREHSAMEREFCKQKIRGFRGFFVLCQSVQVTVAALPAAWLIRHARERIGEHETRIADLQMRMHDAILHVVRHWMIRIRGHIRPLFGPHQPQAVERHDQRRSHVGENRQP